MTLDSLRRYCLAFPYATENLQWGDDLCFKIRGKIFFILGLDSVPQRCCFKCAPEVFAELIERENITPAPYVGRYKWVMVGGLDVLERHEFENLISESYKMAAAKAPKKTAKKKARKAPRAVRT